MTFDEILTQVLALLRGEGRVSYRALKRRFGLDDDYLEDLKAELIQAKKLATDEDGAVLVWGGGFGEWGAGSEERKRTAMEAKSAPRATLDAARSEGERRQLT